MLAITDRSFKQDRQRFIRIENPRKNLQDFFNGLIQESIEKPQGCFILNSYIEPSGSKTMLSRVAMILFEELKENVWVAVQEGKKLKQFDESVSVEDMTTRLIASAPSIRELSKLNSTASALRVIANSTLLTSEQRSNENSHKAIA